MNFDDRNLLANADPILLPTLFDSLGVEELMEYKVSLSGRVGGGNPGKMVLALANHPWIGAHPLYRGRSHHGEETEQGDKGEGGPDGNRSPKRNLVAGYGIGDDLRGELSC